MYYAFQISEDILILYSEEMIQFMEKKPENKKIIHRWKCKICGFIYEGEELPKDFHCPVCGHPASDFYQIS